MPRLARWIVRNAGGDALLLKRRFNSYNQGDVIYFRYPIKDSTGKRTYMIQRIGGLPGDSLRIEDNRVFIKNSCYHDSTNLQHNYIVKTRGVEPDSAFKIKYALTEGGKISEEFDYSYSLTYHQASMLRNDPAIKSVEITREKINTFDEECFPFSSHYCWNRHFYGKVYIPERNDILRPDTSNICLYSALIRDYEKNDLHVRNDSIFINGDYAKTYIVKADYYFVLGDNRDNANDSRSWGFLPEKYIAGKIIGKIRKAGK